MGKPILQNYLFSTCLYYLITLKKIALSFSADNIGKKAVKA